MFKRIMVPYEGSKGAHAALARAAELQKLCDAELLILTVYRHHGMLDATLSAVRPDSSENMDDVLRAHAKEIIEHAKAEAGKLGAKNVRGYVKSGPVARGIISFAKEHDVDLIVVGSRGLGSIEDFLLGSVSHKVIGLSKIPVLVV